MHTLHLWLKDLRLRQCRRHASGSRSAACTDTAVGDRHRARTACGRRGSYRATEKGDQGQVLERETGRTLSSICRGESSGVSAGALDRSTGDAAAAAGTTCHRLSPHCCPARSLLRSGGAGTGSRSAPALDSAGTLERSRSSRWVSWRRPAVRRTDDADPCPRAKSTIAGRE